jgi:predicted phage terminase large subunit-like protein
MATAPATVQDTDAPAVRHIGPQPGFQYKTLACEADILINGGGAGPGKTFALLLESIRHCQNDKFTASIFRRTIPEITKQGGLWDESYELFPHLRAKPNQQTMRWDFPSGASVQFSSMEHEKDKFKYDGSQICLIGFDQLEHFTEGQFWYLWARNRSTCGVAPYIRATCNPIPADDPVGGWLHKLISWWIDPNTGQIIHARDGVIRFFIRDQEQIIWGDSKDDLLARFPHVKREHILSFTFIEGRLEENVILAEKDPGYEAKLHALPKVERERLLHRNWNARPTAGNIFNRAWFKIVSAVPAGLHEIRYWDKAGTQDGGAYTAGVKIGRNEQTGRFTVTHVVRGQWSAHQREQVIKNQAILDGPNVEQWIEQEPGSGGKESAQNTVLNLAGFVVHVDRVTGDKATRAYPLAAQVEAGNVDVLLEAWTDAYIDELHNFDPEAGGYKDQVDASSGAFNKLALRPIFSISGGGAVAQEPMIEKNGQMIDPGVLSIW